MSKLDSYLIDHGNTAGIILVITCLILFIIGGIVYYNLNESKRKFLQVIISLFGNLVLVLNIVFLVYDKVLSSLNKKIRDLKDLNNISLETVNDIFNKFYSDPKNLKNLYNEIIENKIVDEKPNLSYYESNFLFTLFQTLETIYRLYYVSGKDTTKITKDQYEGWDNFVLSICRSPKVQLFYKKNKHLFTSLNFENYIGKYFKEVKIYVDEFPRL